VDLAQIVAEYGDYIYPLIFILTFFEGETPVIFAGVLAHQGLVDWPLLFFCAWIGSFCGDQFYFWVGRRWGKDLLFRFPRWKPSAEAALELLCRYNTWFVLSFRFIYGVRNFASFAMGMAGVEPVRFLTLNFLAAFVWALSFAGFGYVFGEALETMLGDVIETFGYVMLGVFVFVVCLVTFIHKHQQRRFARRAAHRRAVVAVAPAVVASAQAAETPRSG
jgi:membrane protein DedA with SNARE-associated domain